MKIVLSAITYHPTVGGADDFVRSIAEGLADRKHDVTVLASDLFRHVEGIRLENTSEVILNGVRVRRCRSHRIPGHLYPIWPSLGREIRAIAPDIVHGFGLGYYSTDGIARLRRQFPTIISATGGRYRSGRLYPLLRFAFFKNTLQTAAWTALSRDEARLLDENYPDHPPLSILSPSIVPSEWQCVRPDPFPEIPRGHRILFAGRLARDKGIDDLLAILPEVRAHIDARLVIAGPDYGFRAASIPEGAHFTGALDRERLCAAYQHCDVLVLPSYHEGFGIVLLEAMAAGKPVIGYGNSSIPELVRDDVTGRTVPTGDRHHLAEALCAVLADRDLAAAFGARGRDIAFSEYPRHAMIDRVEQLYHSMLQG